MTNLPPLFRSRRFWSGFIGLLVIVVAAFMPELEPNLQEIADNIVVIIGLLIGGFTLTDIAETRAKQ